MLTKYMPKNNAWPKTNPQQNLQLLELLQISRNERDIREHVVSSLHELREWEKSFGLSHHPCIESYIRARAVILRHQAKTAVRHYRQARKSRASLFSQYIESLPNYGAAKRLVS